jgi:hypothetical protein
MLMGVPCAANWEHNEKCADLQSRLRVLLCFASAVEAQMESTTLNDLSRQAGVLGKQAASNMKKGFGQLMAGVKELGQIAQAKAAAAQQQLRKTNSFEGVASPTAAGTGHGHGSGGGAAAPAPVAAAGGGASRLAAAAAAQPPRQQPGSIPAAAPSTADDADELL